MKLNYRDKIILLVFVVLLIIIVFVAWPIKVTKDKIKTNEKAYEVVKEIKEDYEKKIAQIPVLEKRITNVYEEAAPLSDIFIESMEPYKRDQYMQQFFNESKAEVVSSYSVPLSKDDALNYTYYLPHIVNYPILEAAEMNATGSLLKEIDENRSKSLERAFVINKIEAQDVEISQVVTNIKVKKEDLMTFIDAIKNSSKGIRIVEISVTDYTFGKLEKEPDPENLDYSVVTLTINFYSMQKVQKPIFD